MPIIASNNGGGSFTPHPEGQFAATCVDVHDLGMLEVTWEGVKKQQHKIDIYFFCGETIEKEGKDIPLTVRKRFTLSLDERGNLRKFLEAWRGQKFTPEEEKGFDVEKLITAPAFIQVSHNENAGKTYANIDTIMRLPKGMPQPDIPADYIRQCFREKKEQQQAVGVGAGHHDEYAGFHSTEADGLDDLPFS